MYYSHNIHLLKIFVLWDIIHVTNAAVSNQISNVNFLSIGKRRARLPKETRVHQRKIFINLLKQKTIGWKKEIYWLKRTKRRQIKLLNSWAMYLYKSQSHTL